MLDFVFNLIYQQIKKSPHGDKGKEENEYIISRNPLFKN